MYKCNVVFYRTALTVVDFVMGNVNWKNSRKCQGVSVLLCEVSEESQADRARVSDWLASSSNNTHDIKRF